MAKDTSTTTQASEEQVTDTAQAAAIIAKLAELEARDLKDTAALLLDLEAQAEELRGSRDVIDKLEAQLKHLQGFVEGMDDAKRHPAIPDVVDEPHATLNSPVRAVGSGEGIAYHEAFYGTFDTAYSKDSLEGRAVSAVKNALTSARLGIGANGEVDYHNLPDDPRRTVLHVAVWTEVS